MSSNSVVIKVRDCLFGLYSTIEKNYGMEFSSENGQFNTYTGFIKRVPNDECFKKHSFTGTLSIEGDEGSHYKAYVLGKKVCDLKVSHYSNNNLNDHFGMIMELLTSSLDDCNDNLNKAVDEL